MAARSLLQIDIAVATLEQLVPKINTGLQETLRQNTLALESEYQTLSAEVGIAGDADNGVTATGIFSTLSAIQTTLAGIQSQIDTINQSLTVLDGAVAALQAN